MGLKSDEWYRTAARRLHAVAGKVEIDTGAEVSNGADRGAYVAAWVWVDDPDGEEDEDAVS